VWRWMQRSYSIFGNDDCDIFLGLPPLIFRKTEIDKIPAQLSQSHRHPNNAYSCIYIFICFLIRPHSLLTVSPNILQFSFRILSDSNEIMSAQSLVSLQRGVTFMAQRQ
jgi:hypothetical protein